MAWLVETSLLWPLEVSQTKMGVALWVIGHDPCTIDYSILWL